MSVPDVRASDDERDRVVARLREHTATGRLTLEEFGERMDAVYGSTTRGELERVLHDLPAEHAPRPTPRARSWNVAVFGSATRRGRWRAAARVRALALFGHVELDFREAEVETPDTTIVAVSVFGHVDLRVPGSVQIDLTSVPVLGSVDQKGGGQRNPAAPELRVIAVAVFGSVDVRRT